MALGNTGIWVRLVLHANVEVTGYVQGAESPNDFWITFKTQMVRVERATEVHSSGKKTGHDVLHVNRDAIQLASLLAGEP